MCRVSYDVSCVVLVLHKRVVQPDELLVLPDHGELVLLEVRQRALGTQCGWGSLSDSFSTSEVVFRNWSVCVCLCVSVCVCV